MFAPKAAKSETKTAADSAPRRPTLQSQRFHDCADEPRLGVNWNQLRGLEQETDREDATSRAAPRRVAWDFSKVPIFPPNRPSGFQTPSSPSVPIMQAKAAVGAVNDPLEHEADRVADRVMDMTVAEFPIAAEEKEKNLQANPAEPVLGEAPSTVREALRSPGQPLDVSTRGFFEPRFGHDFSRVRIHTDARAAESAREVSALAYTVGHNIVIDPGRGLAAQESRRLLAHELVHTVQQERSSSLGVQRQPQATPELKLVDDFAAKFPAAAKLIKPNPAAMKLVKEAFDAGVKFGGFAEDGPDKDSGRAYTVGDTVYVPKARVDPPVLAMKDFLFELNNAIRQPRIGALQAAAAGGAKTDAAAAKKYAHDITEAEVEGMLRLGEVWFETKKKFVGSQAHKFDQYDNEFYLSEYNSFKSHKKTKEDIVKDVLQRKYDTGTLNDRTVEQHYMEQYQGLAK
jgi:Domain of unknown function (DUF4157)